MNHKLLPLLLLICLDCGAQKKDTVRFITGPDTPISFYTIDTTKSMSYSSISFYNPAGDIQLVTAKNGKPDTSVYIQGDTMALIKKLLIDYFKHQTKYTQYLAEARALLDRLNLKYLGNFAFKDDKDYWLRLKMYNKNKDKW